MADVFFFSVSHPKAIKQPSHRSRFDEICVTKELTGSRATFLSNACSKIQKPRKPHDTGLSGEQVGLWGSGRLIDGMTNSSSNARVVTTVGILDCWAAWKPIEADVSS